MKSIHSYTIETINNGIIPLENYKGKKILLVNVASECGYTKQYAQLEELSKEFENELVVR
jgi:glutathione peroxidase